LTDFAKWKQAVSTGMTVLDFELARSVLPD
jgi:hypothetical protein